MRGNNVTTVDRRKWRKAINQMVSRRGSLEVSAFYANYNVTLSAVCRRDGFEQANKTPQQGQLAVVSRQNAIVKTVTPFEKK